MIDLGSWHVGVRLALLIIPCVAVLSGLAINYHIALSRHFAIMCNSFSRSSALREEMLQCGSLGLKSRFMIIAGMTARLLWPSLFIRRGTLHPDDYTEFPAYLKRRMQLAMHFMAFGMMLAIVEINFIKF